MVCLNTKSHIQYLIDPSARPKVKCCRFWEKEKEKVGITSNNTTTPTFISILKRVSG